MPAPGQLNAEQLAFWNGPGGARWVARQEHTDATLAPDPQHVAGILTAAGWAAPRIDKLDLDLDIATGRGVEAAVDQSVKIGAVSSALREQPADAVAAAVLSVREMLAAHLHGAGVRLPAAIWLVSSIAA